MFNRLKIKKKLLSVIFISLTSMQCNLYAAATNLLQGINYDNPADLSLIDKNRVIIGTHFLNPSFTFNGTTPLGTGEAYSNQKDFLPYGLVAFRLTPVIVAGVSVTEPYYANLDWGRNSHLRFASTSTTSETVRVIPKVSFQLSEKFSAGGGLIITYYHNDGISFVVPGLGDVVDKTSGTVYTYTVGFNYQATEKTRLGFAYFQGATVLTTGTSTPEVGPAATNFSLEGADATLMYLDLVHQFNQKFTTQARVYYGGYDRFKLLKHRNTAIGDYNFNLFWDPVWSFTLQGEYQVNDKTSLLAGVIYETDPVNHPDFNVVAYPLSDNYGITVGAKRRFTDGITAQLSYGYYTYGKNARINNPVTLTNGVVKLASNSVELRLTLDDLFFTKKDSK